jgi:putative membrane protein
LGAVAGLLLGGQILGRLLSFHPELTAAFFMGFLLASIKAVFRERPGVTSLRGLILVLGFLAGFFMVDEPFLTMDLSEAFWPYLIFCGTVSGAAMIIPGISGSAFLIMLGIYNNMLFYLQTFRIPELLVFGTGSLLGVYVFAKILEKFYFRYQAPCAYLFAGLIAGSTKALAPDAWGSVTAAVFLAGFCLVWFLEGKQKSISTV